MTKKPIDKLRLIKLLGRLGSDFEAERATAAKFLTDLLREAGTTWEEIIFGKAQFTQARPRQAMHNNDDDDEDQNWKGMVEECLDAAFLFSEWEIGFLKSIFSRYELSEKQTAVLNNIYKKLKRYRQAD